MKVFFCPKAAGSGILQCSVILTSFSISCSAKTDQPLWICYWILCPSQNCASLSTSIWKRVRIFVSSSVWGLFSEAGLGLGDVDFDAVSAFRGGVLSYWRRLFRRHQPLSGFLPLLVRSRVHTPVLSRWQSGLGRLLWHRWWKLLVFILLLRLFWKLPVVCF